MMDGAGEAARRPRGGRRAILAGAGIVLVALVLFLALRPRTELYRTFDSPTGRYRVEVLRSRSLLPAMPGQAGDAGGVLRLRDAGGKVLREQAVEGPVSAIDQVHWSAELVDIKLIAEWPLSPPDR
jgi:hypothetical protein